MPIDSTPGQDNKYLMAKQDQMPTKRTFYQAFSPNNQGFSSALVPATKSLMDTESPDADGVINDSVGASNFEDNF